ncbi:MAG TPA: hypothetical protein VNK05_13265 [Chloroflexota bacterium]|jgi:hypothetical protein|nr:hypothetical protein [Chloroflexota bacterium]
MTAAGESQTIDMGASMETEEGLAIIDALNEVSDVLAMAGPEVTFVATARGTVAPAGRLPGADLFECPRGWFVLCREADGPHWAVTGDDLAGALEAIHEAEVRDAVAGGARAAGLL